MITKIFVHLSFKNPRIEIILRELTKAKNFIAQDFFGFMNLITRQPFSHDDILSEKMKRNSEIVEWSRIHPFFILTFSVFLSVFYLFAFNRKKCELSKRYNDMAHNSYVIHAFLQTLFDML